MGRLRYQHAQELTITADCGGSNGARVRLWKVELQKFADETGITIHVHHYPPGTSKWNKIEHRMFCHITQNWRAHPLRDYLTVVELIAATTTDTGLKIESALDTRIYQKGIKVSKAVMKSLDITGESQEIGSPTQVRCESTHRCAKKCDESGLATLRAFDQAARSEDGRGGGPWPYNLKS